MKLENISKEFGIPLVKQLIIEKNLNNIQNYVSNEFNKKDNIFEGVVVTYNIDENYSYFLKIKTEEYVKIHYLLSSVTVDKNLVKLIFEEKLDDFLPLVKNDLLKEAIIKYREDFVINIESFVDRLFSFFCNALNQIPNNIDEKERKKIFAVTYANKEKNFSSFLFQLWNCKEKTLLSCYNIIKNYYINIVTNNKKFEEFRKLIGQKNFSDYYNINFEN